jgi:hypothetical protein
MSYELRDHTGEVISAHVSEWDAREAAVQLFGPETDINDIDPDGRALVWRNSEEAENDNGYRAVAVIVEV